MRLVTIVLLFGLAVPATSGSESVTPSPARRKAGNGEAKTVERPALEIRQGRYFRWSQPQGWGANETTNGVDVYSPDKTSGASSTVLMRTFGNTTPREFVVMVFRMVPGVDGVQVLSAKDLPDQRLGLGAAWKVQELEIAYRQNGTSLRGTWTCGVQNAWGQYNALLVGYYAPPDRFEQTRLWLAQVAQSVTVTNTRGVALNDQITLPRNNPLDNSALVESWRQKGVSEDRISQARSETTLGFERMKDPETGRFFEMPYERYDATAGGYRNPYRPDELLQPADPGE